MNLRKGDKVKIISGNDKGKQGAVLAVFPRRGIIAVEGINIKKKHVRPRRQGQKGELVRIPAPFAASRVMLVCSKCDQAVRIGHRIIEQRKYRICKKCGKEL